MYWIEESSLKVSAFYLESSRDIHVSHIPLLRETQTNGEISRQTDWHFKS